MTDRVLFPFEMIRNAAETFADERVKSQLLAELARSQLLTGQCDAALQTFAAISLPQERRIALLTADYQLFPPEKIDTLVKLLEREPQTQFLAGTLALSMWEVNNVRSAWKLIDTTKETFQFESEQQRYHFLEKILLPITEEDWEKVLRFHQTFTEPTYRDWASLAMIKYLAVQQREEEAEVLIHSIPSPLRRSWAYWELCRLSPREQSANFFDKAVKITERITMTPKNEEEMEKLAIQLRIFGRAAFQRGNKEQGEQLLERSESAIACLVVPMQRYRLQCFLGKVLWEFQRIDSIRNYVPIDTIIESLPSSTDRRRVFVWLAEAGWEEGWAQAVTALRTPERGTLESDRAEQIADILKRCVAHHRGSKASGDPSEDTVRISGEELETFYYSPFAEADCGC